MTDILERARALVMVEAEVFSTDGEGYRFEIIRTNRTAMGPPVYLRDLVDKAMDWEREQQARIERLRRKSIETAAKKNPLPRPEGIS